MDTQQLVAFDRIDREGSFVRAAVSLELAQATVSARIQALEREVGGPLFVRGRRVRLTERGERFLEFARRALAVLDEGIEASRVAQGQQGRVTLGTIESLAGTLLASAVERYCRRFPQGEVVAQAAPCGGIVRLLLDGVVGLGLIPWPYPGASGELVALARFNEPVVLVCHPSHPLSAREALTLEEVIREGQPFWPTWLDEASDAVLSGLVPRMATQVELPAQTVRHLLLSGLGAAFLTRALVADDVGSGRLKELQVKGAAPQRREFALVRHVNAQIATPAMLAFSGALQEAALGLGLPTVPTPEGYPS